MITSVHNEQVKRVCSLQSSKGREKHDAFLLEGWHVLSEALKWRVPLSQIYIDPQKVDRAHGSAFVCSAIERGAELIEVTEPVLRKMSSTGEPQGVVGVARRVSVSWDDLIPDPTPIVSSSAAVQSMDSLLLILDRIQDPGNLGGILRVALAAGVRRICLTSGTVDPYNPKAVRSSMGALFGLAVFREATPQAVAAHCQRYGYVVAAASAEGEPLDLKSGLSLNRPSMGRLALILGNEGDGVAPCLLEQADRRWSIPMENGVESLNVAVAAGILLYTLKYGRYEA